MTTSDDLGYVEKLNDKESFAIWNFQISIIFKSQALWEIVNGEKKFEALLKDDEKNDWLRKDAKAQKHIVTTTDKKVLMHIINCKTSNEMYQKLCGIFQKDTEEQKCNLLREFFNFSFQKDCDMNLNISKIENLAYKLRNLKQSIDDNMIISKILSTLPEKYKYFSTAWDSTPDSEKTLTKLTSRLIAEESKHKESENENNVVSFKAVTIMCFKCKKQGHIAKFCKSKQSANDERKCFKCGRVGHFAKNCKHERKQCTICKKTNHSDENCFYKKKENKKDDTKLAFLSELSENKEKTKNFIVDSGCSSHMSNNKNIFENLEETTAVVKVAKKNNSIEATGIGTIEGNECILKNVLYVPEVTKNLLSVKAITENGGEVKFTKEKVIITKNNIKVIEGTKTENGLYEIDIDVKKVRVIKEENEESLLTVNKKEEVMFWHRKLGHLGKNNMKKLLTMSTGINITKEQCENIDDICEVCLKSKQTRFPFKTVRTRASRPLEIVHTDLCGPIDPETWDKKRYILTFLDDFTHHTMVYLLECKSEVPEYVKVYVEEVEAAKNLRVSKLRCDNGKEYVNADIKNYCKKKGIILDYTIPYTPQLNGKAERLNRTIMEKARALIFESELNKTFWGEAVRFATYLLNRNPTDTVEVTPTEMWTNRKPNLTNLHLFGCQAYSKSLGYLKKLDYRTEKFIFVGYSLNGYRLWNENKGKIEIRRDVIFKERKERKTLIQDEEKEENPHEDEEKARQKTKQNYTSESVESDDENGEILHDGDSTILQNENRNVENQKRHIKIPKKFEDYVMLTYEEAVNSEDRDKWKQAIQEEIDSLKKNQTWSYIDKDKVTNKKVLSSRWVFRIKEDGHYKARLVIRGCEQEYGTDYNETYSPVINMSCLRILFALAAHHNFIIKKFDIKTAFLYGNLSEEIYMEVPQGYSNKENKVCCLKKSLYGLKQAPRVWNETFTNFLKSKGLKILKTEKCVIINDKKTVIIGLHVDDGIMIGSNEEEMNQLLEELRDNFEMTFINEPTSFLGIEIEKCSDGIKLKQSSYIDTTLKRFGMENAKEAQTPLASNIPTDEVLNKNFPYREIIGSLLYLSNKTRPDITYAVSYGSRKIENSTNQDVINMKRVLRYLSGTKQVGVRYYKNSDTTELSAFSDSDFAGDQETRKSTTGYVIMFCGGPVSWSSRKQPIVSLSSTEAEYIAAADCVKEILYLKTFVEELTSEKVIANLGVDNQSAISLIKNGQFNKRSKHIDVRYHFINERVSEGVVNLNYCKTGDQIADIFTKPLNVTKFEKFKNVLVKY